jgi:hypothetical protein
VLAALCLAGTFAVHTAAALFLGLAGGVLALSLRDGRALLALAAGSALALPLLLTHLAAGCSLAEALLFSQGDYLRAAPRLTNLEHWDRILVLANPIALLAAGFGARALWRSHFPVAVVSLLVTVLYLNEAWLAPFGARTTLDLMRGLTLFAIPLAAAGGMAIASRGALTSAAIAASAVVSLAAAVWVVPDSCVSKPIEIAEISSFDVDRCRFRWRRSASASRRRSEAPQILPDRGVQRSAPLERTPQ